MKLSQIVSERVTVDLNPADVAKELQKEYIKALGGEFIRDGFLMEMAYTSHSWESAIRKLTEEEQNNLECFDRLIHYFSNR